MKFKLSDDMQLAMEELHKNNHSCVAIRNNKTIYCASGRGVKPMIDLFEGNTPTNTIQNACLADTIIGKAAAMLLLLLQVSEVHGDIMSEEALHFLQANKIPCSYNKLVPFIQNRHQNGLCPIEQSVLDIQNPTDAPAVIRSTIATLMQTAANT